MRNRVELLRYRRCFPVDVLKGRHISFDTIEKQLHLSHITAEYLMNERDLLCSR